MLTTKKADIETVGVFSEDNTQRYELTKTVKGEKGKSILVLMVNPASHDIFQTDLTSNHLLNNLVPMGYTEITVWNLFSLITSKLKVSEIESNEENLNYLKKLLKRSYDTILVGYGNTYEGNKSVNLEKAKVEKILEPYQEQVMQIADLKGRYSCSPMHPLFCGMRFNNQWILIPYKLDIAKEVEEEEPEEPDNVSELEQKMKTLARKKKNDKVVEDESN